MERLFLRVLVVHVMIAYNHYIDNGQLFASKHLAYSIASSKSINPTRTKGKGRFFVNHRAWTIFSINRYIFPTLYFIRSLNISQDNVWVEFLCNSLFDSH